MKKSLWLVLTVYAILSLCSACAAPEPVETTTAETTAEATTASVTTPITTTKATTKEITTAATTKATTTTAITERTTAKINYPYEGEYMNALDPTPYQDGRAPGTWRISVTDATDEVDAAEKLAVIMFDSYTVPSPDRSFTILEYKDISVEIQPTSVILDLTQDEYQLRSPVISENAWLVNINASFRYTGMFNLVGKYPEDMWWSQMYQNQGLSPMILIKTDSEYLAWWSIHVDSCPEEILQLSAQTDMTSDEVYSAIEDIPGLYRISANETSDREEAAQKLWEMMVEAMTEPGTDRTFYIEDYTCGIRIMQPSSIAKNPIRLWGIPADSPLITENTWIVYPQLDFDFVGVYAPFDGRWYSWYDDHAPVPLILLETPTEYLMWWSTDTESAPMELLDYGN